MSLVGFDVDGRYGPKTEAAVKTVQRQFNNAVDGVVGPQTWAVIDASENEGPASEFEDLLATWLRPGQRSALHNTAAQVPVDPPRSQSDTAGQMRRVKILHKNARKN
jgi:lysozyme family protein